MKGIWRLTATAEPAVPFSCELVFLLPPLSCLEAQKSGESVKPEREEKRVRPHSPRTESLQCEGAGAKYSPTASGALFSHPGLKKNRLAEWDRNLLLASLAYPVAGSGRAPTYPGSHLLFPRSSWITSGDHDRGGRQSWEENIG